MTNKNHRIATSVPSLEPNNLDLIFSSLVMIRLPYLRRPSPPREPSMLDVPIEHPRSERGIGTQDLALGKGGQFEVAVCSRRTFTHCSTCLLMKSGCSGSGPVVGELFSLPSSSSTFCQASGFFLVANGASRSA